MREHLLVRLEQACPVTFAPLPSALCVPPSWVGITEADGVPLLSWPDALEERTWLLPGGHYELRAYTMDAGGGRTPQTLAALPFFVDAFAEELRVSF